MVADEAGLQVAGLFDNAGTVGRAKPQINVVATEESKPTNDFESRLAALRR